jgi:outer membrane protein TolC
MRFPVLAAACTACLLAAAHGLANAQAPASPFALTLNEALRQAELASPAVKLREAQLAAAEGARQQASTLLANNPELSVGRNRTQTRVTPSPDERSSGWSVGIAQPIEIGGQQARRREAAAAALDALRAEIEDARRQARSDAALRFHAVLAIQRRIQIEQRSVDLFDSTAQAVAKRRTAGEDTRLDANVALVEAERARNALAVAREQWLDARSELAAALQLPPSAVPSVAGELATELGTGPPYSLDQLVTAAQALPRLRALSARESAARARLGVERASRLPDLTVGVNVGPRRAGQRTRPRHDADLVDATAAVQAQSGGHRPGAQRCDDIGSRARSGHPRPGSPGQAPVEPPRQPARARATPSAHLAAGVQPTTSNWRPSRARPARSACWSNWSSTARRWTPSVNWATHWRSTTPPESNLKTRPAGRKKEHHDEHA